MASELGFSGNHDALFLSETSDSRILYSENPITTGKKTVYFRGL